ncbi:hypothetical protein, partial [Serratia marcescens]|uniref:hypothetical protein n=1 Tax=Serratia marcescens TaxID=615 RepID=UPI001BCC2D64
VYRKEDFSLQSISIDITFLYFSNAVFLYSSYEKVLHLSARICKRRYVMSDRFAFLKNKNVNSDWLTIKEAVKASKNND